MSETAVGHIDKNLDIINKNLIAIGDNVLHVSKQVKTIGDVVVSLDDSLTELHQKHDTLALEVDKFSKSFEDYVGEYRRKTELQLAETQIVKIRQELEHKFGYYAEIRRMATGILQGVDNRLVTNDILQFATEEAMIKAPGYWLAPTLVCVACWLRDDKQTAERAVRESIRRDDYRTSLFFTLLTRRINRNDSTIKWIERYFRHQNPRDLDREFIVILEAVSTGIFPPASKDIMVQHVKDWVAELSQTDDFIDQQKDNWIEFYKAKKDTEAQKQYPILIQFATNWQMFEESLQIEKANKEIHSHFNLIISSGTNIYASLIKQLDELLKSLVTNFDDEELPLKKRERECELIIEKKGDKDAAFALMATEEKIFEQKVDFLQMLTNAAFNPGKSGASAATQALAISISQPWMIEAYNTFVAEYRIKIPQRVEFDIDGFKEATVDGSEEQDLLYKQSTYYEKLKDDLIANAKFPLKDTFIPGILIILGVWWTLDGITHPDISQLAWLLISAIGAFWIFRIWKQHESYKNSIEGQVEEKKIKAAAVLRGLLAETVECRYELKKEDNESENVLNFLNNINSDQFMSLSKGAARSILT